MMKKILAIALSTALLFTTVPLAALADATTVTSVENEKVLLSSLNIMSGDANGNWRLQDKVSRAECAKIAVAASSYRNYVSTSLRLSPFRDVPYTHWAAGYIKVAAVNNICKGYTDATFRPNSQVTFAEAVTMMLKVLGYTDDDFGDAYPNGQLSLAKAIGLTEGMNYAASYPLSRRDMVTLSYQALDTKMKGNGNKLFSDFDVQKVEDVTIIASHNENNSLASDKISTSNGNYYITSSFDKANVGKKGDLYVKNGDKVMAFVPTSGNSSQRYVVYSILSDGVVAYHNGNMQEVKLTSGTTVYNEDNVKSTYAAIKSEISMGDVFYVSYNDSGAVDYLTYNKGQLVGPVTVSGSNWLSSLSGMSSDATIIRNGSKSTQAAVSNYDIVYYSKEMQTVFAYHNRVTGIYESAAPNKDTPSSVVVSGKSYEIEGVDAFSKLASYGNISLGDTVTLLLGKDGKVANVLAGAQSTGSTTTGNTSSGSLYGLVCDTGIKSYTIDSKSYTYPYVSIVTSDGEKQELRTQSDYKYSKNTVVKVTIKNGIATLESASQKESGTFDWSRKKFGSSSLSPDVNILDVSINTTGSSCTYTKIFGQRLDGISLSSYQVMFAEKNAQGKIVSLFLKDVTGDGYQYGIVTKAESSGGMSVSGQYTYDLGGALYTISTMGTAYNISGGTPTQFHINSSGAVDNMKALTAISSSATAVTDTTITAGSVTYTLSDRVAVYARDEHYNYTIMPLSDLSGYISKGYSVHAYYDKTMEQGGRVRVILVTR